MADDALGAMRREIVEADWLLRPLVAIVFAGLAIALHSLDSWTDQAPIANWAAEASAIAVIAVIGIWAAEQSRSRARFAEGNARLADERQREAERMRALAKNVAEEQQSGTTQHRLSLESRKEVLTDGRRALRAPHAEPSDHSE